ncbi:MAG: OB-fold nucleic acid binding domain-containing protein, partial [Phycisphaerae bacterium]
MNDCPRVSIKSIGHYDGQTVRLSGWLYNLRRSGKIAFPILRDGTGFLQCVA